MCVCVRVFWCSCVSVFVYFCVRVLVCLCVGVFVCWCVCVLVCLCVRVFVCLCVCVLLYLCVGVLVNPHMFTCWCFMFARLQTRTVPCTLHELVT